ncbi:serine endopeptidase [Plectosphaerella plurivora]|uniref:Serine endopeptidase n=1 Tax=Plectosphaerella plurivora TaxID=936078 RepID=A0A9P8VA24_9PEZI|nr:serine endopeptidase [Plectosphaerella plurivora]
MLRITARLATESIWTVSASFGRRDLSDTPGNGTQPVIINGVYTIELNDGASPADVTSQLDDLGISIQTRRVLDSSLFKGLSFNVINAADYNAAVTATTILQVDAVKQVWPVRKIQLPPDDTRPLVSLRRDQPGNLRAAQVAYGPHVMSQVDLVHEAGFTGKGVKIAVLDTGVDYTHPLLGGCFGPGCIVESGYDTVGVDFIGDDSEPKGDDDPMDCYGHGTHVAGIISALPSSYGFKGVAPGAKLSAYRVMDCLGYATDETIIDGMLRAFDDGNDILSMSLGDFGGFPEDLWSITATRIIEAGVPIFVAVGNFGEYSMFSPQSPADGRLVSSISSFDPITTPVFIGTGEFTTAENETGAFEWTSSEFDFAGAQELTMPVLDLSSFTNSNGSGPLTGCEPLPSRVPDLSGYIVLVEASREGECLRLQYQQHYIYEHGGRHVMYWLENKDDEIFNNVNVYTDGNLGWMHGSDAKLLRQALASSDNVSVTLDAEYRTEWAANELTGGEVSHFSSWGPNWDMRTAPTFGAAGHMILSTVMDGKVQLMSGTSMSTPLVAGAAALLMEARGTRDPKTIQDLLASTAKQVPLSKAVFGELGGLHPPTQAGNGIIQVLDAVKAKGLLSTTGISFNDSDHHISEVSFTLKNTGSEDATYHLGYSTSLTTYAMGPDDVLAMSPFDTVDSPASLSFSSDNVKVSAGGETLVTVRCEPPRRGDASRWPIYSGYITLNGTNGDNLAISFVGNAGSMRDAVVMPDRVFTMPRPVAGEEPPEISSSASEYPHLRVNADIPTRMVRVDILPSSGNFTNGTHHSPCDTPLETWLGEKTLGEVWGSPFRNVKGSFFNPPQAWITGHLANGKVVPPGRYQLMLSGLGLFRDTTSNSTEDWQVAKTTSFILNYQS